VADYLTAELQATRPTKKSPPALCEGTLFNTSLSNQTLFHQNHLLGLVEVLGLEPVEIDSAAQLRAVIVPSVPPQGVHSRALVFIHQGSHYPETV